VLRAVIFDLDDTLFPEHMYVESGFRSVAELLAEQGLSDAPTILDQIWQEYRTDRNGVFDRLLLAMRATSLTVSDLVERYRTHKPSIVLDTQTRQVIDAIRGQYKLGLISDGWLSVQTAKVQALGLGGLMDAVCLTDQWGRAYWKPHPRAFEHILDEFGVAPREACYVGDNLTKDFLAPNRLGMHSVHLHRRDGIYSEMQAHPGGEPEVRIGSLDELRQVVSSW
jgi:putative hydrolase of the HAD superfamily